MVRVSFFVPPDALEILAVLVGAPALLYARG
jgi:hypothetical protein